MASTINEESTGSKRLIVFDFDRTLATVEVNAVALTDAKKAMGGKYRVSSYTRIYFFLNTYLQQKKEKKLTYQNIHIHCIIL